MHLTGKLLRRVVGEDDGLRNDGEVGQWRGVMNGPCRWDSPVCVQLNVMTNSRHGVTTDGRCGVTTDSQYGDGQEAMMTTRPVDNDIDDENDNPMRDGCTATEA